MRHTEPQIHSVTCQSHDPQHDGYLGTSTFTSRTTHELRLRQVLALDITTKHPIVSTGTHVLGLCLVLAVLMVFRLTVNVVIMDQGRAK